MWAEVERNIYARGFSTTVRQVGLDVGFSIDKLKNSGYNWTYWLYYEMYASGIRTDSREIRQLDTYANSRHTLNGFRWMLSCYGAMRSIYPLLNKEWSLNSLRHVEGLVGCILVFDCGFVAMDAAYWSALWDESGSLWQTLARYNAPPRTRCVLEPDVVTYSNDTGSVTLQIADVGYGLPHVNTQA